MLHGASHEVGMSLVQHKYIKAVGFTGSYRGGKALFDAAAGREEPIPVYAEMGSVNPVFILPNALAQKKDELAKNLAASITLGVGQFCTNPGLFVLEKNVESQQFAAVTQDHLAATPMQPMLTDTISNSYTEGISRLGKITGVAPDGLSLAPQLFITETTAVLENEILSEEVFGPCSVGVMAETKEAMIDFAKNLKGQLTATVHGTEEDLQQYKELVEILTQKAGRVVINGFPTGVEVGYAMVHGGPFPATTDSRSTSVGTNAIYRFTRPVCFQDFPDNLLPDELQKNNPLRIRRMVDGAFV
jgi:NADP-dependent aldehyde dehydrogenase